MLQVLMAVAFSAAPLILYVPPLRSLNLFVETLEVLLREIAAVRRLRFVPRLRVALSRFFSFLIPADRRN